MTDHDTATDTGPVYGPDKERRIGRAAVVLMAVIAGIFAMIAGFMVKKQCEPPRAWDGYQYTHNCYNDIMPLYGTRGGEFAFRPDCEVRENAEPSADCRSVPFSEHGLSYRDNRLEYPPLTGLAISAANAPVERGNAVGFFRVNALMLAVFGVIGAAALAAIARNPRRMVMYVLAPAMISYAFLNWDLLAVGLMALGLWAFVRERDVLSAALLGLGAAAKIFPGLIIPALMLARRRDGKPAWPLLVYSIFWFAVPNLVVLLFAGVDGWSFPYDFQTARVPNFETFWYFILHHGSRATGPEWNSFWFPAGGPFSKFAQYGSMALFGISLLILLWRESLRGDVRPITTGFGIMILFLMTTKVFSPQFAIWLLPFFVLVRVPWHAFVAFVLGDLFVLGSIWAYLNSFIEGVDSAPYLMVLEVSVFVRYAALVYVLIWTRRVGEDLTGEPEQLPEGAGSAAAAWAT